MNHCYIPEGYAPMLNPYETQLAISTTKRLFADSLCAQLNLRRVSAPLFVEARTGLNDDLNGVERPVSFDIAATGTDAQVVHSLAKWKRYALAEYCFMPGTGLYTDMNAIRRDEELDNLHSIYVDQWDWEKVITYSDRNMDYLKNTVRKILGAIITTEKTMRNLFPALMGHPETDPDIVFLTTQELEDLYPDLTPKERENAFVKEHHTVFLMQIGGVLKSGIRHDGRAPDYDDWAMNGDLLLWNDTLQCAYELSSMGIRVDAEAMERQLTLAGCENRKELPFHQGVLSGELPLSIGGGIGQSRLCVLLLGSAHIGEVQCSIWDSDTLDACREAGIPLL